MKEYNIDEVSKSSLDELYQWLSQDLSQSTEGVLPVDPFESILFAKAWVNTKWNEIEDAICSNTKVYDFLSNESDEKTLIFEVSNIIIGYLTGISPIIVSAILVKRGLKMLCKSHWQTQNKI